MPGFRPESAVPGRRVFAAAWTAWLVCACGEPSRPPELSNDNAITPLPDGGSPPSGRVTGGGDTSFPADAGPSAPECSIGVEGGVCACADQPLLLDPPNFFFVLDRSGSMSSPWNPSSALSKWETVLGELKNLVVALGPRASYAAAEFPDTFNDGCAAPTSASIFPAQPGVLRGDTPAGTFGSHESSLIAALRRSSQTWPQGLPPNGGTPTAETLRALKPKITSLPGKTYVILATDGGPNCNGAASCSSAQCTDNIEGAPGCPFNAPPNCCDVSAGGSPLSCLDSAPTIAAVQSIASAGVPVYVIGVPDSEPYAALLNELAVAGGTARGTDPQYYAASAADPASLLAALSKIAAKIVGTCTLTLDSIPPDPGLVNVFLDGKALPQPGPDGWTLDGTSVTIQGASCQKILSGDILDVRVVGGCPTLLR